ncbi:FkbM family methyltransferase [Algoriphagus sp.]|uniref:FkbM family methyltransferase n=1 Tax=Algoriphagus sp. TaxID=1872435 RepID=UPI0027235CDB|nr:FkbM family methyltransferase [Algoriphagus sp.]MDO8967465.1 FkbM family methyltransferase [Algoriphagus sp.]MDP3201775.1 FkbM family methyltransferase [Algoriphagus sp.]
MFKKNIILNSVKEFIFKRYNISFSKSGEDLVLAKILQKYKSGYFVDVGCWDPINYSNTYYFYLRGFQGICIDPNPRLVDEYRLIRPKDRFILSGVGMNLSKLNYYYIKKDSSLNTFNYDFIKENNLEDNIDMIVEVNLKPLSQILDEIILDDLPLLFFDIDVEGFDLDVLKSNNWTKYRPYIVMVESSNNLKDDLNSDISSFLQSQGYQLVSKTLTNRSLGNLIFLRTDFYDTLS